MSAVPAVPLEVIDGGRHPTPHGVRFRFGMRVLRACRWPLVLASRILGPAHPHAHIAREIASALREV